MEFSRVVGERRMVRSFSDEPVESATVDEICDLARRAPSAGNTSALDFLVLEGSHVAKYWDVTLPMARRSSFAWPGLLNAAVLVVIWTEPDAYLRRYREPDKASTRLGSSAQAWPIPYWYVDSGAAVMTMLLAAVDRGLGACFFGLFDHEEAIRRRFQVPPERRAVGTVAIGHRANDVRPSQSAMRPRGDLKSVIHRSSWSSADSTDPSDRSDHHR